LDDEIMKFAVAEGIRGLDRRAIAAVTNADDSQDRLPCTHFQLLRHFPREVGCPEILQGTHDWSFLLIEPPVKRVSHGSRPRHYAYGKHGTLVSDASSVRAAQACQHSYLSIRGQSQSGNILCCAGTDLSFEPLRTRLVALAPQCVTEADETAEQVL